MTANIDTSKRVPTVNPLIGTKYKKFEVFININKKTKNCIYDKVEEDYSSIIDDILIGIENSVTGGSFTYSVDIEDKIENYEDRSMLFKYFKYKIEEYNNDGISVRHSYGYNSISFIWACD